MTDHQFVDTVAPWGEGIKQCTVCKAVSTPLCPIEPGRACVPAVSESWYKTAVVVSSESPHPVKEEFTDQEKIARFDAIHKMCLEHLECVERGDVDEDWDHWIFEGTMIQILAPDPEHPENFWKYYNSYFR